MAVSDTSASMPLKRVIAPKRTLDRALFMAEISEWYDWIVTQIAARRLIELDTETSLLVVANAIRAVDRVEPRYYGSLQRRVRARMIKAHILLQYWERRRVPPK